MTHLTDQQPHAMSDPHHDLLPVKTEPVQSGRNFMARPVTGSGSTAHPGD